MLSVHVSRVACLGLDREEMRALKAAETPEQKLARRLAKKEAKERKKRMKMGWDPEALTYSNADNPFGDANLTEEFTWHKVGARWHVSLFLWCGGRVVGVIGEPGSSRGCLICHGQSYPS